MQELQKFGISNEPDAAAAKPSGGAVGRASEAVTASDAPVTIIVDYPFPPTLSKTSLGISLSETELSQR